MTREGGGPSGVKAAMRLFFLLRERSFGFDFYLHSPGSSFFSILPLPAPPPPPPPPVYDQVLQLACAPNLSSVAPHSVPGTWKIG
ncbi:uncharacterized protein BO95DRAFT_440612 [Aspergillus brunneoviolaceus CBS 621.78]|uniref:Uncharacterized protein n=1 Tax=Aspergillus brunneoviolaceus CBS 621.78 TaxID=1450534 RepID=A0ACD1GGB9_9EURO|nr:hypothetical protein BO95DRAFT_440612 [Aspergillus brunneoviolaceus CBS 621.78]RAH48272.1 hypothetical protein BO95DRAFT_440612 [Aspergillus brunneoviolaceus CBS 621.78]